MASPVVAESTTQDVELIAVEGPEPEERDELLDELLPALDATDEEDLRNSVLSEIKDALLDRSDWEDRYAGWDDQYHGRLPDKRFPWVGSSNLHVPLTMLGIETMKPRLVQSILGGDPPIMVATVEQTDEERQERVELYLNWQARTELNYPQFVHQSAHMFLNPGTVVGKAFWKVDRRRQKYVRSFPVETSMEQVLLALFGQEPPEDMTSTGETTWEGTLPTPAHAGPPMKVTLRLKVLEREIQVLVERETLKEGVEITLIDPLDVLAPAKAGGDIQKMPWFAQRLWLTEDDLRRKVKLGRFSKEAVDTLLQGSGPEGDASQQDGAGVREGRAEAEGVADDGESDARAQEYAVWEVYKRHDIDDDGFEEEVILWVCEDLPKVFLGWDYLDNVHAHGKRPYAAGRYLPLPFKFLGLSFPEIIQQLQDEINTIHNQRVDYGTIQNLPMYFYKGSSTHLPTTYSLKPGQGVPVDNPATDIVVPRWQGSAAWGQQEEALLYQYFERLTGLTDLALGRQPNRVGATRTASGMQALLGEGGLRFKTAQDAFQQFHKEIWDLVLALDQEYLPPGKEFRVTGRRPEMIRIANRTDIAGRFDIRLSANTESLNRSIQREDATVLLQALGNPLPIQLGLVGLKGLARLYRDLLKAYGKTDPDAYLEIPRSQVVRSPDEELALWVSGVRDIHPSPLENLALHLDTHMNQLQDPQVMVQLGREGMEWLKGHVQETLQVAQMQMVAQNMQQGGGKQPALAGPQAANAQIGRDAPNAPQQTTMAQEGSPQP